MFKLKHYMNIVFIGIHLQQAKFRITLNWKEGLHPLFSWIYCHNFIRDSVQLVMASIGLRIVEGTLSKYLLYPLGTLGKGTTKYWFSFLPFQYVLAINFSFICGQKRNALLLSGWRWVISYAGKQFFTHKNKCMLAVLYILTPKISSNWEAQ